MSERYNELGQAVVAAIPGTVLGYEVAFGETLGGLLDRAA